MELRNHFGRITELFSDYNSFLEEEINSNQYQTTLFAAFVKSIEFNSFIQKEEIENSFFYSPFLRGLCEDLIALKYIYKHFDIEKDEWISIYKIYLVNESISAQTVFFDKKIPKQNSIRIHKNDNQLLISNPKSQLKKIMVKKGYNDKKVIPSVKSMAIDSGLKDIYGFLYHATSKMVHFSPHILLRMGWNENDQPFSFSTYHFSKYYSQFNRFYSAYLFVEFAESFKKLLNLQANFLKEVKEIKKILHDSFYPEIVTYEELNQERPKEGTHRFLKRMSRK